MYEYLSRRDALWKWLRIGIYNVIGWGLPFLLMVIPTSANKMGFLPGATLYAFHVKLKNPP